MQLSLYHFDVFEHGDKNLLIDFAYSSRYSCLQFIDAYYTWFMDGSLLLKNSSQNEVHTKGISIKNQRYKITNSF